MRPARLATPVRITRPDHHPAARPPPSQNPPRVSMRLGARSPAPPSGLLSPPPPRRRAGRAGRIGSRTSTTRSARRPAAAAARCQERPRFAPGLPPVDMCLTGDTKTHTNQGLTCCSPTCPRCPRWFCAFRPEFRIPSPPITLGFLWCQSAFELETGRENAPCRRPPPPQETNPHGSATDYALAGLARPKRPTMTLRSPIRSATKAPHFSASARRSAVYIARL